MAINWDEVKRKGQQKGAVAESQVQFKRAVPSLPKAPPKLPMNTSFGSVLDEYNTSLPGIGNQVAKNLAPERKQEIAQGTQRFFEKAPVQAGFMQGVSFNNPLKSLERKLSTDIDTTQAEKSNFYKAGELGGIATQFALPYAGASKGIAAGLTKLPKYAQLGKLGQGVAKSVATDLAVGLPLNANYAYNKEGLQGKEAAKSIALNTGLDLITGGILEAVPMFLKSGKKVASKVDFDNLPPAEKTEVMSELERLAYESNVRKGKITPQNDTLYGNSFRPTVGELPAPQKTYLHATNKEFDKFKPAGDGLIYFSEKKNGVKTKADAIYSTPTNNRMIESQIDESKIKEFDPFTDPEAKAIAEKYGLPTDRSYVKWDDVSPMSLEAIQKGYNSFNVLEPSGEYSRAIADPNLINITNDIRKPNAPPMYANAVGQREVPRTITPNELPRANKVQPLPQETIPRATESTVRFEDFKKDLKYIKSDTDGGRNTWEYNGKQFESDFDYSGKNKDIENAYKAYSDAKNKPVQPRNPNLGTEIPTEIKTPETAEMPINKIKPITKPLLKVSIGLPDLPVRYNPNMKNEARNLTDHIEVGDKFNAIDGEGQKAILGHENAHNISNDHLFKKGYFTDILSNKAFGESKTTADGRTYWEGIFGDVGATSVDETLTDTISVFIRNPKWLKETHPDAYNYIAEKVMKSAPTFKGKPQPIPRATKPAQPILPQKGAEIPTAIKTPENILDEAFNYNDATIKNAKTGVPISIKGMRYGENKNTAGVGDYYGISKKYINRYSPNVQPEYDKVILKDVALKNPLVVDGNISGGKPNLASKIAIDLLNTNRELSSKISNQLDAFVKAEQNDTLNKTIENNLDVLLKQGAEELGYDGFVLKRNTYGYGDNSSEIVSFLNPKNTTQNASTNETYKKALMQTALDEYDRTIVSIADYISNYKPKGVDIGVIPKNGDELMRDGGIRYAASKNDLWYQDFYKKHGRKPSKSETKELATQIVKESLRSKSGEFYNPDLGKIVEELHGLKKDLGADTFKGEKTIDDLVNEFGAMPKGESPRAREINIPNKTNYGDVQQYARTLQESAIVDDTLYKDINEAITQGSFTKPTKSNKTAVEDANYTIEQGLDESVTKFKSVLQADKQPTSYDIALGNRVLQELQKSGRYEEALDVAVDLSEMLSETGRTLQAARIAKRLSPEGRLMIASRTAEKVGKKTGKKIKISDETVEQISKAKTEKEVVEANQKAAVEIWNQVPANWSDKINSYRYMSMLFNPKTHVRNIVGNALFLPVREFKNLIGTGLEKALIRNGERTKAVLNPLTDKPIMEFASKDFENVKSILKNEGKLDDNVRSLDAKVFDTKILEGIRSLNLKAMDTEDTWFMKFAYDSSLAQYMKANKIKPENMVGSTLESGRKYAINEALKATYRDANALANIISRAKHNLSSGKRGTLGKAGGMALEGLLPFTKTPMNIIKRGVAYSPANIIRGVASLAKVKSGKVTATEAIDQLASGLSGTALLALGTYLGYNNIVNGKEGEYKDKLYNYNQMLGSQNYSLNIDGKSYTLDWAAPLSMPFFVGVEISKAIKDNNADLASVLDSMTQISDPMVNLSMLKGINDIITNNFEGLGQIAMDIGMGYLGQFNPTLFGQISRSTDNTRRSTISTAETSLEKGLEKFGRKQIAKLPLASNKLEPYIDLWGREQKNGTVAENFLSPGYFKQENITNVDKELQSLIGKLDEDTAKTIIPNSSAYQYTIESGSIPYRMTEKESTAYQKTKGKESYNGLNKLFASIEYRKMNSEEKVKAIQDVYSEANEKAKYEYFDSKGLPVTLALSKDYQEKYKNIKAYVSDKQFYSAVQKVKGKSTNIEKAYALAGMPDKILETFGIDTQAKEGYVPIMQKVNELKQSGISINDYTQVKQSADINASGNISKAEAEDYLNNSNYSQPQRAAMLKALVPNLKDKNNPYY